MHTTRHLDDEHMQLYEWSGAGTGMLHTLPTGSKRSGNWHASYGVLAVLTSLLILNGCDNQGPAEQAGEQASQAAQEMKDEAAMPAEAKPSPDAAQEAGQTQDGDKPEPPSADASKP